MIGSCLTKETVAQDIPPQSAARAASAPLACERPWIACEIHDGFVQDAFAAKMLLDTVLQSGRLPEGENRAEVKRAADLMEKAICEARRLIGGMRLPVHEERGMAGAVEALIDDLPSGSPAVRFATDVRHERWNPATETAVYRIVQEALHNIRRHSRAERAEIRLFRAGEGLHLEIEDWGIGFDPANVNEERFGLQGIRQRARLLQGRAAIESAPGKGTRIVVDLPAARAPEQ
ncbi:MAG: sensor histidine kinase [Pirellulales bacterium]|nr:sensor histidine kinase [Pirellulales bacterium]